MPVHASQLNFIICEATICASHSNIHIHSELQSLLAVIILL